MAKPSPRWIAELNSRVARLKVIVDTPPNVPQLLQHFAKLEDNLFLLRPMLAGLPSNDVTMVLLKLFMQLDGPTVLSLMKKTRKQYQMVIAWENDFLRGYGKNIVRSYLMKQLTQLPNGDIHQLEEGPGRNYLLGVYQHPDVLALLADFEEILSTYPQPSGANS